MDVIQLFTIFDSCMDMEEIPTTISERYIHSNNHTADNNTQYMFALQCILTDSSYLH